MILGDLVANLTANIVGFVKPMQAARKESQSTVSAISSAFGSIKGLALGLGGGLVAALGFKEIISGALDAEKAGAKFQAVLDATNGSAGVTLEEMRELASDLQRVTNFEDDATTSAAAMLAGFGNIKGDVFKNAVVAAADLAAATGQDLDSAMRALGKSLSDPIKGLMILRKQGVSFTEEQKAQVKAMVATGDIVGAQNILLKKLQDTYGGVAKATADPFTQLKNMVGDLGETLGALVLPVAKEFTAWLGDLVSYVTDASGSFAGLGEDIAFAFRNAGDLAMVSLIDLQLAIFDLIPGSEQAFQSIGSTLVATFDGILAFFSAWKDNIIGGLKEIGNVAEAVGAGISASFQSIKSGDLKGAAGAFADAFVSTLANQKDVGGAKNPFTEFGKAYEKTKKEIDEGFKSSGGLGADLKAQKEQLLDAIAAREKEREDAIVKRKGLGKTDIDVHGPVDVGTKKQKSDFTALQGSKEALTSIFENMRGSKEDRLAKLAEDQLAEQRRTNDLLETLPDDIELDAEAISI